jgi:hypothetical protein
VGDNGVEDIGIEISAVIPENCAHFRVDLDSGKVSRILQGGKDARSSRRRRKLGGIRFIGDGAVGVAEGDRAIDGVDTASARKDELEY